MRLQFLGTGADVPAEYRDVTNIVLKLLDERNEIWLFDCDEGTQMQILRTAIYPRGIGEIFITYLHGSYVFGPPGLINGRSFQDGGTPSEIYGPKGIEEHIKVFLGIS